MMYVSLKSVLKYLSLYLMTLSAAETCTKVSSCSCVFSSGVIDLSPLSNINGTAFFHNFSDLEDRYKYSWNPCHSFSDGEGCEGVAACQSDPDGHRYSLGTQDTSHFITDHRLGLLITYHAITDTHRRLFVRLECNRSVEYMLNVQGETGRGGTKYFMNLISKHACPVAGRSVSISDSLTVGEILVILLVVVILLYVAVGLLFQIVVRKASGRQLIPDYCLWPNVPQLIKDVHISYRAGEETISDTAAFISHMETSDIN